MRSLAGVEGPDTTARGPGPGRGWHNGARPPRPAPPAGLPPPHPGEAVLTTDHRSRTGTLRASDLVWMLAIVATTGTALVLWSHLGSELIPVRDGIGYDGATYAKVVQDPSGVLLGHQLDVHRVQRVLPSLVVHLMLRPFGLHTSDAAIVVGFQILNYTLMALSTLFWWRIARRLELSRVAGWAGFLALVVNYGLLKYQAYSSVMTDSGGFFLGVLTVWCLVFRRHEELLLVAVLGSFTWPTVTYAALGLYVLSRPQGPLRPSRWWGLVTAGVLAVVVPALSVRTFRCGTDCASTLMNNAVVPELIWLSTAFLVLWMFFAFRPLLELLTVPNVLRSIAWLRLVVAVVVLVALARLHHELADPSFRTVSRTLYNTLLGGVVKPAGFLVAHAAYFGPAVVLLVLTWRRAVGALKDLGLGAVAVTTGFLFIAITCEARILMNEWPMFVLLAAMVVDRLDWRARSLAVFAALSVVASRIWFPIYEGRGPWTGDWRKFPDQYIGMSLGLKMTVPSYLMMGAGVLVCAVVLWPLTRRGRSVPPAARADRVPEDPRERDRSAVTG